MPWPAITARWSAPPPLLPPLHMYTRGPHHCHIQLLCTGVRQTCRKKHFCHHTVQTCRNGHIQTKTPGFISLSCFYPLYQNSTDSCFSVGVCILHISASGVLWTLLFFWIWILLISVGFILTCGVGRWGQSCSLGDPFIHFLALIRFKEFRWSGFVNSIFIQ